MNVGVGSKERPRTVGCVAMGNAVGFFEVQIARIFHRIWSEQRCFV